MKPLTRVLTSVLAPLAVLVLAGAPAAAHGGEGEIEVTSVTRSGDEVTVTAHLKYVEDGHGVPDATVTVVVGEGTAVPMGPGAEEGDYTVTVPAAPGTAIRVTSVEPATTAEATAPETAETGSSTTEPTSTTAAEATTTDGGPTTPTNAEGEAVPGPGGIDDAPEDLTGKLIASAIAVVVLVALAVAVVVLRKRPSADEGPQPR